VAISLSFARAAGPYRSEAGEHGATRRSVTASWSYGAGDDRFKPFADQPPDGRCQSAKLLAGILEPRRTQSAAIPRIFFWPGQSLALVHTATAASEHNL
jgi:hypothetical protein